VCRIETFGGDVGDDAFERGASGHATIDEGELVATVDQVDVTIGIVGEAEAKCRSTANHVDLVGDAHRGSLLTRTEDSLGYWGRGRAGL